MSLLDQWLQHPKLQAKARQIGRSRELIELGWMMRSPTSRMALRLVFDAKKKAASDDLPAAKQLYLRAIELEPNYFRAHSFLAMIHHRLHEYDDAFSHWDFALAIKAKDIGSNLGKAESFFATDRLSEGTEIIDQLLALFPKHAEIFARRALFAERAQNIEASLVFWRRSSQLDPNNPEFALGLARVLIKLDQKLEGKGILDRLKKLRADHLSTQIEVGRGLLRLDYSSEAVEHFERLLWANPYEIPVLNGLINSVDAKLDVSQVLDWWRRYLNWDKIKSRYISHPVRNPAEAKRPGKTKLLFVSYKNWNFMQDIVELMDADQDFEIRTLELNQEIVTALETGHRLTT
jgi:tetratricopeptide (TPR) repeat protein